MTTDVSGSDDVAFDFAILSDGRITVTGEVTSPMNGADFAVVRYNADGTLDASFDSDDMMTIDFANSSDSPHGIAIGNSEIVVAGTTQLPETGADFAVAIIQQPDLII